MGRLILQRGESPPFNVPAADTLHPDFDVNFSSDGGPVLLLYMARYNQNGATITGVVRVRPVLNGIDQNDFLLRASPVLNAEVTITYVHLFDPSPGPVRIQVKHAYPTGDGTLVANEDFPQLIVIAFPEWQRGIGQ